MRSYLLQCALFLLSSPCLRSPPCSQMVPPGHQAPHYLPVGLRTVSLSPLLFNLFTSSRTNPPVIFLWSCHFLAFKLQAIAHYLKQCFFRHGAPWIGCLRITWRALTLKNAKSLESEGWKFQFLTSTTPSLQGILEHAQYEACRPKAVILNLGNTPESPGKL